jgi:hypothetical protein
VQQHQIGIHQLKFKQLQRATGICVTFVVDQKTHHTVVLDAARKSCTNADSCVEKVGASVHVDGKRDSAFCSTLRMGSPPPVTSASACNDVANAGKLD